MSTPTTQAVLDRLARKIDVLRFGEGSVPVGPDGHTALVDIPGLTREQREAIGAMLMPADAPVSTRATTPAPATTSATPSALDPANFGTRGTARYAQAFDNYLRRGRAELDREDAALIQAEYRDQVVGTTTAGGYLVPPGFIVHLTEALKQYGGMLANSNVQITESGQALQWPTVDDTGNTGALLAEVGTVTALDIVFGQRILSAYMYTSRLLKASIQLMQDSAFDLNAWLPHAMGIRIGRIINNHFTLGTGAGAQPAGIIPNATVGVTAPVGNTVLVPYDSLVDLISSLDPAYRENAQFMLNDATLKVVKKLKDSQGHPIWQPSVAAGQPETILGYAYFLNQDMVVPAASAKTIAFGDFKRAYLIRQVRDVQVLRLSERYADTLEVGFIGFGRWDGVIDDGAAVKLFQHSVS